LRAMRCLLRGGITHVFMLCGSRRYPYEIRGPAGAALAVALALVSSAGDVDLSQVLGDDLCDEVLRRVLRAPTLADVVA